MSGPTAAAAAVEDVLADDLAVPGAAAALNAPLYIFTPVSLLIAIIINMLINEQYVTSITFTSFGLLLAGSFVFGGNIINKGTFKMETITSVVLIYLASFVFSSLGYANLPHDSHFPLGLSIFIGIIATGFSIYNFKLINNERAPTKLVLFQTGGLIIAAALGFAVSAIAKAKKENMFKPNKSGSTVRCSRPATQAFKCTVYKNGKPVEDVAIN